MKAATQHIMDIVASFFAASDDSFQAGYTIGAGSSSKTAMMAPVHSKESASKLGSMYFLKFLKNILILNLIHIIGSGVKGGHFLLKSGGVS